MAANGIGLTYSVGLVNLLFHATAQTNPAGVFKVSLHTADPGVDGQTANEVTGTSYARISTAATDWTTPTVGGGFPVTVSNSNALAFPTAGGTWTGPITYFGLWRATGSATTDFIARGTIPTPQSVASGNTASFAIGALVVTFTFTP